jgi:hypothetical protein
VTGERVRRWTVVVADDADLGEGYHVLHGWKGEPTDHHSLGDMRQEPVVSLSDLQREIAGLHIGDFADSHPYDFSDDMRNGWNEALETVASRLGIDDERKG